MPPEATTTPEVVEVVEYEQVQADTRLAAINVLSSDGPVEVTESLRDKPAEVLAMMQRLASAAGMTVQFGHNSEQSGGDLPIEAVVEKEPSSSAQESGVVATDTPEQKGLDETLRQLKADFDRGIVLIDKKGTTDQYKASLKADRTAGKEWEKDIKSRLLADNAALLKKAAAMPEGGQLIGIHDNGDLAIRQRSKEIVNARWTKNWSDGQADRGELCLMPHAEALAQEQGRWAKPVEILRAVKAAGYHVPADAPDYKKKGLVAASEAVTEGHYVMSPEGTEWRSAILECADDVSDSARVRVVGFDPGYQATYVRNGYAVRRDDGRGAVLWLRG